MNRTPLHLLLGLALFALMGGLAVPGQAQTAPDKKTGVDKIDLNPLDPDLRALILKEDVKDLLKELKHAGRLSREGQKLTRIQVLLKIEISKWESFRDRFATVDADKALVALGKEEVRTALKKVASMPPGPDREKAFKDFAFVNGLALDSIGQAYQLQKANQRLGRLRDESDFVQKELQKLEANAAVSELPFVPGSFVGNQTVEEALKSLEEMRKNSGSATGPKPVTQDSLDFLRDFLEPQKK